MMKPIPLLVVIILIIISFLIYKNRIMKNRIAGYISAGALVIDVRTGDEFRGGHFSTAKNIPYDQIADRLSEVGGDKTRPVILYCHAGSRAAAAQQVLQTKGYTNVVNAGGYDKIRKFDKK